MKKQMRVAFYQKKSNKLAQKTTRGAASKKGKKLTKKTVKAIPKPKTRKTFTKKS